LLFSEQGETMQCTVGKDEHEQTETENAVSVFSFQFSKKNQKKNHANRKPKTETETVVSGGSKPKTEPTIKSPNRCISNRYLTEGLSSKLSNSCPERIKNQPYDIQM